MIAAAPKPEALKAHPTTQVAWASMILQNKRFSVTLTLWF
jgi:hypothetical protein